MKQFEDEFFAPLAPITGSSSIASPRMEWQENEKAYLLSFDIPGMKDEDIKVDLKDRTLTVSAERKQSSERKEGESIRSEKFYGMYERSIELPQDVESEGVQAEYSHGVLEVLVPKTTKTAAKNIQIGKQGKLSERFFGPTVDLKDRTTLDAKKTQTPEKVEKH
jgi:HSP20 family protein